jgi:hypothetical protein
MKMSTPKIIENIKTLKGDFISLACTDIQYEKILGLISLIGKENLTIIGFDAFTDNSELCGYLAFDVKINYPYVIIFNKEINEQYENDDTENTNITISIDQDGLVDWGISVDYSEIKNSIEDLEKDIKNY